MDVMNSGERASERASRREGKGEERLKEKSGTGGKVQFLQWEGGGGRCAGRNTSVETPRESVQVPMCAFNRRGRGHARPKMPTVSSR